MKLGPWLPLALAGLLAAMPAVAQKTPAPAAAAKPLHPQLNVRVKPWKGDFDAMLQRRMILVLVPYSRSLFYIDKGRERGLTAELARDFERYVNQKYSKQLGKRPLTVYLIPTTRDKLLGNVEEGLGDIAAGNLTATDERRKVVDFVLQEGYPVVKEFVVTGPSAPPLAALDDLAGKTVHVRPSSSYAESLARLNARFASEGKAPVAIRPLPDALEDEDVLEMVNAGLVGIVVVDDWKARTWAQVLPKLKVRSDLVLSESGEVGWAIRKGSPGLDAALRDFHANYVRKVNALEARVANFQKRVKQMKNNTASAEMKRFQSTVALFEKYGTRYGFDPLMLAAQGFQESQLQQEAKSAVGAIGVMQVMPATGKDMGVGDITVIEPNIHAGAKYMDLLMSRYFADAAFDERNRPLFAFAAYNCGPGNIAKMRREAAKRGLDPNKWFNNVELVVSEKIGMETTTYVRNIYKYYAAYRLVTDAEAVRRETLEQMAPPRR